MRELEFPLGLPAFESYTLFRLVESSKYAELLFLKAAKTRTCLSLWYRCRCSTPIID